MIGIYKIENKLNGKCYIGQSVNIEKRWKRHKRDAQNKNSESYNYPLQRAFRKYNIENFDFSIVEECKKHELNEKEIYWINKYNSRQEGYNISNGGNLPISFNIDKINKVKELLKTTYMPFKKIAEELDIGYDVVVKINKGIHWVDEKEQYPLRPKLPPKNKLIEKLKETNYSKKEVTKYFNIGLRKLNSCIKKYEIEKEEKEYRQKTSSQKKQLLNLEKPLKLNLTKSIKPIKENKTKNLKADIKQTFRLDLRKIRKPTKEKLLEELKEYQGNLSQIGRIHNVCDNSVKKWCKTYNIDYKCYWFTITKEEIIKSLNKNKQMKKTCNELNISLPTLKKYCKEYDIDYDQYLYHKPTKEEIITLLKETNGDLEVISKMLSCTRGSVSRYLKQYDLKKKDYQDT